MHAAVHGQRGAGRGTGRRRRQVVHRVGHLLRRDKPARRVPRLQPAPLPAQVRGRGQQPGDPQGVDNPGHTQLTRMQSATKSAAMASVMACTAPLVAEYRTRLGRPAKATTDEMFTMAVWVEFAGTAGPPG